MELEALVPVSHSDSTDGFLHRAGSLCPRVSLCFSCLFKDCKDRAGQKTHMLSELGASVPESPSALVVFFKDWKDRAGQKTYVLSELDWW